MPKKKKDYNKIHEEERRLAAGNDYMLNNLFREYFEKKGINEKKLRDPGLAENPFSIQRSICQSVAIGLLLEKGMSLDDICDENKGRELKAEVADEILDKMYQCDNPEKLFHNNSSGNDSNNQKPHWIPDLEWTKDVFFRAINAVTKYFDENISKISVSTAAEIFTMENLKLLSLYTPLYDIIQELQRKTGKEGDLILPGLSKDTIDQELLRPNMASRLLKNVVDAAQVPENIRNGGMRVSFDLANAFATSMFLDLINAASKKVPNKPMSELLQDIPEEILSLPNYIQSQIDGNKKLSEMQDDEFIAVCNDFADALESGAFKNKIKVSKEKTRKGDPLIEIKMDGIDVMKNPDALHSILIFNKAGLTYQQGAKLAKENKMTPNAYADSIAEDAELLEEMGLTMDYVKKIAIARGITKEEYIRQIRNENEAAEKDFDKKQEKLQNVENDDLEKAEDSGFKTLGDVERFLEKEDKPMPKLVEAFRAVNQMSEEGKTDAYRCYQSGVLLNFISLEISKQVQQNPEQKILTQDDLTSARKTIERHIKASEKMGIETTLTENQAEKNLNAQPKQMSL